MKMTGVPAIDYSTAEWVVGSDEVGFGAWAGPLVVVACGVPRNWTSPGVGDSKDLTARQREQAFHQWTVVSPVLWKMAVVSSQDLDRQGVGPALLWAHRHALEQVLAHVPGEPLIVVDGFPEGTGRIGVPGAIGLPDGDVLVPAVSLASIIAKVSRDATMVAYDKLYPGYGFAGNKGYGGSAAHEQGLNKLGVCEIHRKSYGPIAKRLREKQTQDLEDLFAGLGDITIS